MIHAEQTCIFWRERTFFLKLTKFHVSPTKIDSWVGLRKIDAHTATPAVGVPLTWDPMGDMHTILGKIVENRNIKEIAPFVHEAEPT